MRRHALVLMMALAVGTQAAMGIAGADPVPASPLPDPGVPNAEFYTPPAPLPSGSAGDLLRTEPSRVVLDFVTNAPIDAHATRIMYLSRTNHGEPTAVTGTVLAPTRPWTGPGERPLVSFAAGTQGVGDQCAPSHLMNRGHFYEIPWVGSLLAYGAAVVVTDYQGLGTPGLHTYLNRAAEAHAQLDATRAAQRLGDPEIPADGPVGLMGYSQGGHSTASAVELQPTYAPELDVIGAYAGAAPANVAESIAGADGSIASGFFGFIFNGAVAGYPEHADALRSTLTPAGEAVLRDTETQCTADTILTYPLQWVSTYNKDGLPGVEQAKTEPMRSILDEQRIGRLKPAAPVLIVQGAHDDLVLAEQSRQLGRDWCAQGADVQFRQLDIPLLPPRLILGHGTPLPFAQIEGISWLVDRVEGRPFAGNCGTY
ncbi:MAG: lipase family protein [Rhodococcus sp. (in: high G+C Gram-positive bacteria)]|uniref:lipase family protein n=1 Tax=Rhodococcus sp. TaxID=1831 RepID=UPI003BB1EBB8